MADQRGKGMQYVREVRKILEDRGLIVEGPAYKPLFVRGKMMVVHTDYFSCFDLMVYDPRGKRFGMVQVSTIGERSRKVKRIVDAGIPGLVFSRDKMNGKVCYRVMQVDPADGGEGKEERIFYLPKGAPKIDEPGEEGIGGDEG